MHQRSLYARPGRPRVPERLEVGRRVRDRWGRTGVVVDVARRYLTPKADPIYNYLIRWDDGLVTAVDENALGKPGGIVGLG